ncbi:MAG: flippase-like domain-containing protein [Trueperaceae bacterium]|nr:flippase-like domain-containing protein [Trueperaceae bacterium]
MLRAALLAIVFGVAGIFATLWLLGESVSTLGRLPLPALAVGVLLVVANYAAGAHRLWLLMRYARAPVTFIQSLRAYAVGLFTAAASPGSAGQAPAVVLSLTRDGVPASRAWSANVHIWALDLAFLAWSLPVSLIALGRSTRILRVDNIEVIAILFALAAAALIWILQFRLEWLTVALTAIFRLRPLRRWQQSVAAFGKRVQEANTMISSIDLLGRVWLHVLTITVYVSTLLTFYVMVRAFDPNAPLLVTMAAAQVPMVLATFFPTPGGAGILEVLTASILRAGTVRVVGTYSGDLEFAPGEEIISKSGTVAAAILGWRLLTFYSRYVIGPVLSGGWFTRKRAPNTQIDAQTEQDDAGRLSEQS